MLKVNWRHRYAVEGLEGEGWHEEVEEDEAEGRKDPAPVPVNDL
jgi:hypothetical protein